MPVEHKDNTPKTVKPQMPSQPSAAQLAQTFDVAQLPTLDGSEGGAIPDGATYDAEEVKKAVAKSGMDEVVGKPVTKEAKKTDENNTQDTPNEDELGDKPAVKPKDKKEETEEDPFKGELEDDKEKDTTDSKEEGIPEFLKPPTASKDNKKNAEVDDGTEVNYADFNETEVRHMKNMNRQARKFVAGLIKAQKESTSSKQLSFLQHPQGYMLAPEYQELQSGVSSVAMQYNHWKQQLMNCKAGQPVSDLEVDAQGNIVVSAKKVTPNDEIEELCRTNMLQCQSTDRELRAKMQAFPKQYSGMVSRDLGAIRAEIKTKCPWVANPKLLDYTMDVHYPGGVVKQESIKTVRDNFINLFPAYMRNNNIGLEVAANLLVANVINEAKVRHLESKTKAAVTKVAEVSLAEPSVAKGKPAPKPKVHGVSEFNMSGAGIEFGR